MNMNKIKQKLENFFSKNDAAIIVNTTTDRALLCLRPVMEEMKNGAVLLKFDSLNDHGGNSVILTNVLDDTHKDTLYVEFEDGNVLMLQTLSMENYRHYILPQYFNSPAFNSMDELKAYVINQK